MPSNEQTKSLIKYLQFSVSYIQYPNNYTVVKGGSS